MMLRLQKSPHFLRSVASLLWRRPDTGVRHIPRPASCKNFITHIHTDHIFDLDRLLEKTKAQAWVSEKEPLQGAESFASGRIFHIGALSVETRLTSGHAVGGVTYFIRGLAKPISIVGDSIFAGSMGGGKVSYADALRNNREQVLTLPEETIICPGHGHLTTVGEQKWANPFLRLRMDLRYCSGLMRAAPRHLSWKRIEPSSKARRFSGLLRSKSARNMASTVSAKFLSWMAAESSKFSMNDR